MTIDAPAEEGASAVSSDPLLTVRNLVKHFTVKSPDGLVREKMLVKAVDDVSFDLERGQTLGLVGESGCGKSTTARVILRLIEPTSGEIVYDGTDLATLDKRALRRARRDMQIVFQDPYASLDPRMTVREIVGEGLRIWNQKKGFDDRVAELLEQVGLNPAFAGRYPHEFSGGQRQRIGIARAMAMNPKMIILDEPVSALDVSVQAQILNLLSDLQDELDLTMMFIAHDLSVVRHVSSRVAVMYLGKIVEIGASPEVYGSPQHPYTQALLSAVPTPDPPKERLRQRIEIPGDPPSPIDPPPGCRFHTRCPIAKDICKEQEPVLADPGVGHEVACHFPGPL